MRAAFTAFLLLSSCSPAEQPLTNTPQPAEGTADQPRWQLRQTAAGPELTLAAGYSRAMTLACSRQPAKFLVNVPAFRPIASEERLSFGDDGNALALVADVAGDPRRGGVTGAGEIPDELKAYLTGRTVAASYGAQTSGPFAAPPYTLTPEFLRGCADILTESRVAAAMPNAATHPCNVQGDRLLTISMRALGTEPFWNARVQGRCVTYSHPEDQQGLRLWTRVSDGPAGPIFVGAYHGHTFRLELSPAVDCSDGMSDNRYDWEARLLVEGEERRGCAEVVPTGR